MHVVLQKFSIQEHPPASVCTHKAAVLPSHSHLGTYCPVAELPLQKNKCCSRRCWWEQWWCREKQPPLPIHQLSDWHVTVANQIMSLCEHIHKLQFTHTSLHKKTGREGQRERERAHTHTHSLVMLVLPALPRHTPLDLPSHNAALHNTGHRSWHNNQTHTETHTYPNEAPRGIKKSSMKCVHTNTHTHTLSLSSVSSVSLIKEIQRIAMVYIGLSLKVSIKESIYTSGRVAFLQCLTSVIHCSSVYSMMWQRAALVLRKAWFCINVEAANTRILAVKCNTTPTILIKFLLHNFPKLDIWLCENCGCTSL